RIVAARQRVVLSTRTMDAEIRQFNEGLRTSTDVLNAQTDLANAQLNLISNLTQYQIAQIDIVNPPVQRRIADFNGRAERADRSGQRAAEPDLQPHAISDRADRHRVRDGNAAGRQPRHLGAGDAARRALTSV